jgi:hypothetical protein
LSVGEPLPDLWLALALLATGATGFGLNLRFYESETLAPVELESLGDFIGMRKHQL